MEFSPNQYRNPEGEEGRLLLEDMNDHHFELTKWALSKLPAAECGKILDIGCGGGMLISLLAERFANAEIFGVDISEVSLAMTALVNKEIIKNGRCHISLNSVSALPFADSAFDLVTAFETYFFWPDQVNDLKKAASKVKRGGYLVVVSETYPHPAFKERNDEVVRVYGLKMIDNDVLASILEGCGMDVTVNEIEEKNWITFVAKKR
ncbi:MAG: methyltransferase domain-containing protein [Methanomassiliicoccaceae archaeon]|jgi:SAM-dependent methyltransferase|nr:methyltransferase domain-containing protein [Methanomassiliicoccaceae archaeon]